jgi:cation transport ATPase
MHVARPSSHNQVGASHRCAEKLGGCMNSDGPAAAATRHARAPRRQPGANPAVWVLGLVILAGALLVCGGYVAHWRWTGLSDAVTLWDWLEVLALPVAVGIAPLLLRHRRRLTARHRAALLVALAVFAAVAVAAYVVPLGWAGFRGNTLWDWLQLWLLPLVVAGAAWQRTREPQRAQRRTALPVVVGLLAVVFLALVFAGYLVPLTWTGFTGNTAWDWIKLLLVPVLVPTVLLPALVDRMDQRLAATQDQPLGAQPPTR